SAEQARDQLAGRGRDRIHVVDSQSACGGEGLVVLAAHAAAARGLSAQEVVAHAREARAALQIWFAVDTLEFLRRGGRIGAAQAYLGSALRIKPILTLGKEIEPIERVRTAGRAVARMKEYLEQRREEGADRFAVQHIRDPERAAELVAHGRTVYGNE